MEEPLVFALPGNEAQALRLAAELGTRTAALEMRSFPDGETYLRIGDDVRQRAIVLVCTLRNPDAGFLPLYLLASALREQ
ncbi:MAG TPA: ribose-phosphate pyrophosphokinase-like domain-containing protein, partial [Polyangiaceae bacterium]|nr:ribose-phosphate pyrophosphokinase-like domain-containing protein [Polyangiaceae bacterium]